MLPVVILGVLFFALSAALVVPLKLLSLVLDLRRLAISKRSRVLWVVNLFISFALLTSILTVLGAVIAIPSVVIARQNPWFRYALLAIVPIPFILAPFLRTSKDFQLEEALRMSESELTETQREFDRSPHLPLVRLLSFLIGGGFRTSFLPSLFISATFWGSVLTSSLLTDVFPGHILLYSGPSQAVPALLWVRMIADLMVRVIPVDFLDPFGISLWPAPVRIVRPWGSIWIIAVQAAFLVAMTGAIFWTVFSYRLHWRLRAGEEARRKHARDEAVQALAVQAAIEKLGRGGSRPAADFVSWLNKSHQTFLAGERRVGIALLQSLTRAIRSSGASNELRQCLLELGTMHSLEGEHDKAVRLLSEGVEIARQLDDHASVVNGLRWRGWSLLSLGKSDGAIADLKEAEWVARIRGVHDELISVLDTQAEWCVHSGLVSLAAQRWSEADELAATIVGFEQTRLHFARRKKAALIKARLFSDALECARLEERLLDQLDMRQDRIRSIRDQVDLYVAMEGLPAALERANAALVLAREYGGELQTSIEDQIRGLEMNHAVKTARTR